MDVTAASPATLPAPYHHHATAVARMDDRAGGELQSIETTARIGEAAGYQTLDDAIAAARELSAGDRPAVVVRQQATVDQGVPLLIPDVVHPYAFEIDSIERVPGKADSGAPLRFEGPNATDKPSEVQFRVLETWRQFLPDSFRNVPETRALVDGDVVLSNPGPGLAD